MWQFFTVFEIFTKNTPLPQKKKQNTREKQNKDSNFKIKTPRIEHPPI